MQFKKVYFYLILFSFYNENNNTVQQVNIAHTCIAKYDTTFCTPMLLGLLAENDFATNFLEKHVVDHCGDTNATTGFFYTVV